MCDQCYDITLLINVEGGVNHCNQKLILSNGWSSVKSLKPQFLHRLSQIGSIYSYGESIEKFKIDLLKVLSTIQTKLVSHLM